VPVEPAVPDFDLSDADLRAVGTCKWTQTPPGVLAAWVAEMDVRPCPEVHQAVLDAVTRGCLGYPAFDRQTGVPEATAGFVGRRYGWKVGPDEVLLTADVMSGVRLALEVLADPAPVIVPVPSYPPLLHIVPLTGRRLVPVPCVPDTRPGPDERSMPNGERETPHDGRSASHEPGRPALDLQAIDDALAAGARTVLLSNPHNPVGRAFEEQELTALRDLVTRHGARVISDEVHAPLVLAGARHLPYASLDGTADHTTTVVAASKAWNVPGLRCAQIISQDPEDLRRLRAVPHVANDSLGPLGAVAAVAAYEHGEPWLDGLLDHLAARRAQFTALVERHLPDVRWTPMEASYLAWLDVRALGLASPARTALADGGVMLQDGRHFGTGYEGFARVALATSAERLERIVAGMARAWYPG